MCIGGAVLVGLFAAEATMSQVACIAVICRRLRLAAIAILSLVHALASGENGEVACTKRQKASSTS